MKLRRTWLLTAAVACVTTLSGCATALRGYREYWEVESTPPGATASLSNGVRCTTPCKLKLPRKHGFAVEFCKAGFRTQNALVSSNLSRSGSAMIAGNAVLGGVVGAGTDVALGSNRDLVPDPLRVSLQAESPGCGKASFPSVPEDGQSPASYRKAEARRQPDAPLRYSNSHGREGRSGEKRFD